MDSYFLQHSFQHSSCAFCDSAAIEGNVMFCSKCRIVVYCSKEHQVAHWKRHKKFCKEHIWGIDNISGVSAAAACRVSLCACKKWYANIKLVDQVKSEYYNGLPIPESSSEFAEAASGVNLSNDLINTSFMPSSSNTISSEVPSSSMLFSRLYQHPAEDSENHAPLAASANQLLWKHQYEQLNPGNSQSSGIRGLSTSSSSPSTSGSLAGALPNSSGDASESGFIEKEEVMFSTSAQSNGTVPFQHRNNMQYFSGQSVQQTKLWINQVWQQVIEDMNRYGVCVVDNLLGEIRGGAVLKEVQTMYSKGAFQDGQLVKGQENKSRAIRGDKITWLDGKEAQCRNIAVLIKLLDNIVIGANHRKNNGKLGTYNIKERSKAMVACYPGSGTHYVKHVDNPSDDGRCVTAIYYLNKDWNTKENGGLLRIFPEGWSHQVADIEPLFDRVIFFWSDRRNPHEVQPAYKTRYAITLWYYDSDAKARAIKSTEANLKSS